VTWGAHMACLLHFPRLPTMQRCSPHLVAGGEAGVLLPHVHCIQWHSVRSKLPLNAAPPPAPPHLVVSRGGEAGALRPRVRVFRGDLGPLAQREDERVARGGGQRAAHLQAPAVSGPGVRIGCSDKFRFPHWLFQVCAPSALTSALPSGHSLIKTYEGWWRAVKARALHTCRLLFSL